MTYKSVLENMVERAARQKLEHMAAGTLELVFGKAMITCKSGGFYDWLATFRVQGKPYEASVAGYISENGFINPVTYYIHGTMERWEPFED